ncbi:hypothetical protein EUGRSUZ_K01182 [Eucalyptus grandis]|uniref:Uncharacterized protein n=2 Tax=Eucalyptus grandis TaxID=71139 RepID=A0ACC3ISK8_EUCGR|nr:hypothetical protein EUGRSUZ_K01182 [Eucalyptus grandis]
MDVQAQDSGYPMATLSTQWTNNATANHSIRYNDATVRLILLRGKEASNLAYACGFYCDGNCNTCLFAIVFVPLNDLDHVLNFEPPRVVWSANRHNPVKIGATLELTSEGDLVLKDADGTVAWSTNTSHKSVVGLNLTDLGNLMLFDKNNVTVWQSFDHPTDSLVLGQKLKAGQRLVPSVSETNWTVDSMITLFMNGRGLSAQLETSPPQIYYQFFIDNQNVSIESPYVQFENGNLAFFSNYIRNVSLFSIPQTSSLQYIKLGSDGHLRVYQYKEDPGYDRIPDSAPPTYSWVEAADLLEYPWDCGPRVCGRYGICSNGQCSCPTSIGGTSYFKPVNYKQPNIGCFENIPLSCGDSQNQSLLELIDVMSFAFNSDLENIDATSCKEACRKNCSCKAAIFKYGSYPTNGSCYLSTQVFSLMNISETTISYNSITYLKVQNVHFARSPTHSPEAPPAKELPNTSVDNRRSNHFPIILGSSFGGLFGMMILIVVIVSIVWKRDDNEAEEINLLGMPTRFTSDALKAITDNFSKKLGECGFGSVFEGTLIDSTKVAIKRIDGFGQVKKSFLTEVETIGSIHHINLVRLMGFCAEKSHRLLIYEYMPNGSLDRWIFHKPNEYVLDWPQRRKIILNIANGLKYLHEDCRQKILHLDIKPHNILLDGNFNAKVADFGLSKLVNRNQSQVITTMRGTPGYLALEWLSAVITEKVDVYSFGVVILEIVCGRKVFDCSLDEEDMHLLGLFKRKGEEERLLDIVDKKLCKEAFDVNGHQGVIKVLEGVMEVPDNLDYNFSTQPSTKGAAKFGQEFSTTTALSPSILSGPR